MKKSLCGVVFAAAFFGLMPFMGGKVYVNSKPSKKTVEKSGKTADHSLWVKVLAVCVDKDGLVNYKSLKKDKDALKNLQKYLNYLAAINPDKLTDKKVELSYWINFYNAAAIAGVLGHYPVKSVKDIEDFWTNVVVYAGKKEYSLADIENNVLREIGEPRIHWAIVRASKGCARLLAEPYTSEKLEEQLASQEKRYLVGRKQVYIDREKRAIVYTSLFYWYGPDFIKNAGTKLDYVKKYLSEEDLEFIENNPLSTKYIKYDWSLNQKDEQPQKDK